MSATNADPKSRPALITGCSSGLGRQTALALHRQGHTVYATARRPEAIADLAAQGLHTLALDVTDEESMAAAVRHVEQQHGSVGLLINNAAYGLHQPVELAEPAEIRAQFDTNVFGLVRMTQLVLPGMRAARSGRIVNISSMAGKFSPPGGAFYHASKHAVEAISDSLRLEVAPFGVKIVVVQPGPTITEFGGTAVDTMGAEPAADDPYGSFRAELAAMYGQKTFTRRNGAVTAETATRVIVRAATTRNPRARYAIGGFSRAVMTARRLLPDVAFDAMMRTAFPLPKP
ncbi:NAD(P)-dependent dehydrogenase (short-subunit alcohol dehydrogenase family) [Kitasatospora sp. MAP12-15]|uniref:SDR family NAD(P)-dependent oxidoreductase n=1 Tax=unclassified Kitasatospora TaxID=2633591 RepID=UPI002475732B|nr:SDR family NAD(P)-dependent oxidoreductase [Kitasatospora sp. MAP12-44]MDH6109746.1 NAD(P)-dependent dehydrogenase (short-subunit alcohol dehydrogenase family) [Kitasatospora sp. MAP12-44]